LGKEKDAVGKQPSLRREWLTDWSEGKPAGMAKWLNRDRAEQGARGDRAAHTETRLIESRRPELHPPVVSTK